MTDHPLDRFSTPVRRWFTASFAAPTPAQAEAWDAISGGDHALVVAPTGSGKTLAAFLWSLDMLVQELSEGSHPSDSVGPTAGTTEGVRVLYISPLKALGVDVQRNLVAPLTGIRQAAAAEGVAVPEIRTAVRSGDTPASERARMTRRPPHVLITTPESLFLMLTSAARETLRTVHTVIVDEVHAVAATKRGTHLALSLERLDALLARPAQRIGLSATVRPVDTVAAFLGGDRPARVVAPASDKRLDLTVRVTVPDLADLPDPPVPVDVTESALPTANSLWPHLEHDLLARIDQNRSTLIFVNSRRTCERLTSRLNELHRDRLEGPGERPDRLPAQIMLPRDEMAGAPQVIARSHHGSVSKDERASIEAALKSGELTCVVATSSLELGIDMGAIDEVIQMGAPPSVAAALQRIGRAGHAVGEVSKATFYPLHRLDVLHCAAIVQAVRDRDIEHIAMVTNALDVLAQQVIAHVAAEEHGVDVEELFDLVRRAGPYRSLPRAAFDGVLDLVGGVYPAADFPDLRARVHRDPETGRLTTRRGAQRLAVTNGGTIPDRGLFGVYLAGEETARRVGELDEEMVYESRVGDVITLGASSWRVTEITHDRVLVAPAPGHTGRLPFWVGDPTSRPATMAQRIGALARDPEQAVDLDEYATANLAALVADQRAATRVLPDEQHVVIERIRDDIGDWRILIHAPWGRAVNAPWAQAIAARFVAETEMDPVPVPGDDGIVLRLPDAEYDLAAMITFEPAEVEELVTARVGDSALFASRFRECAARALLLPRRDPGRRAPLWQQRQRAAQLLAVARTYTDFPVIVEAARECLSEVYDMAALRELMTQLDAGRVTITQVDTETASPYAESLLFAYTGAFVYSGDTPLAERAAALLSLDPDLLAQVLGRAALAEILDPEVVAAVGAEVAGLTPRRRATDAAGIVEVLRRVGPLTRDDLLLRVDASADTAIDTALSERTITEVRIGERPHLAAVDDLATLRDALGVPVPTGFTAGVAPPDPLGALVARFAWTHGPFTATDVAGAFAIGNQVARQALDRLVAERDLVAGEFVPGAGAGYCDATVLRRIRARSLAVMRAQIEPVDQRALPGFLADHHQLGRLRGTDGVFTAIEQLAGVPLPASAWETHILPARVGDYAPGMLDELVGSGEVVASGHGRLGDRDGWVALHPADLVALTLSQRPAEEPEPALGAYLTTGSWFLGEIIARAREAADPDAAQRLESDWSEDLLTLWWSGRVTPDSFAPIRAMLSATTRRTRSAPRRPRRLRLSGVSRPIPGDPRTAGRWSRLPAPTSDPTEHARALGEVLLHRHGVVTRGALRAEQVVGGFALVHRVFRGFEDAGQAQRGYFIDGLGAAQFARASTVDVLRRHAEIDDAPRVLAATDPANPFGAALDWPGAPGGHRPGRKVGALVVLAGGTVALFVERGGRSVLVLDEVHLDRALVELAESARAGRPDGLVVTQIDGEAALTSPWHDRFIAAGFVPVPSGLRVRRSGA